MWFPAGRLRNRDGPAGSNGPTGEGDRRWQQERGFELDVYLERVGEPALEGVQAASLQPHAVGDRPAEAEEAGRQCVEVDGVDVAGHRRVPPADVSRDTPYRRGSESSMVTPLRTGGRFRPRWGSSLPLAAQVGAGFRPNQFITDGRLANHVELPAARMGAQVGGAHGQVEALVGTQGTPLGDAVDDMDEARQGEGKLWIDHERNREGKREHMRVGRRQQVGMPEATNFRVARQPLSLNSDAGHLNRDFGQPVTAAASSSGDRLCVEASQTGPLFELDRHAPRMLWPQTRMTWPLTPAVPGWPSQATVSATSTGSPLWLKLLIRRPISRVAKGMAFVIAVSMNPGATALIVISRSAIAGANAWTMPMMPALLAA